MKATSKTNFHERLNFIFSHDALQVALGADQQQRNLSKTQICTIRLIEWFSETIRAWGMQWNGRQEWKKKRMGKKKDEWKSSTVLHLWAWCAVRCTSARHVRKSSCPKRRSIPVLHPSLIKQTSGFKLRIVWSWHERNLLWPSSEIKRDRHAQSEKCRGNLSFLFYSDEPL